MPIAGSRANEQITLMVARLAWHVEMGNSLSVKVVSTDSSAALCSATQSRSLVNP